MSADSEADRDFPNLTDVAETVAEIITQTKGKPSSIAVSGAWGVGKSSMIRLIRNGLAPKASSALSNCWSLPEGELARIVMTNFKNRVRGDAAAKADIA